MANIKVSEMTEATSFDDGDYTMIVQANQNKKISKENMLSDIPTIQNNISTINNNIGNLTNLETSDKSSIVNSINSLTSKILWTNPSPTSNFASQNITLSSSDYDMLLWIFSTGTSNSQYISFYTIKGKGVYASWVYNSTFLAREINYSTDTQYAIGDNKTNGTTNNASTIPQYVIGYKTGLFSNEGE